MHTLNSAIVLDTETTDTEEPQPIELAYCTFEFGQTASQASYSVSRYKPTREIQVGACATHHIIPEDLNDYPSFEQAYTDYPPAEYWIGHKVDFDWKVLREPPVKRICTLAMARAIWPKCNSHTLVALTYFTQGMTKEVRDKVTGAHNAAVDITLCHELVSHIVDLEGIKTLPDLYGFSEESRIPKIMTFGKYKDQPVSAVDRGWANWYYRQADTDPYLITALRKAGKL